MKTTALCLLVLFSGCAADECDVTKSQCVISHDFGVYTVPAASEDQDVCMSWTMDNADELWVNDVLVENRGNFHHSNWFFVPDRNFDVPDGAWNCTAGSFDEITAAISGGVLYAQSTQARTESQTFPPGVAVRIPPNSRMIAAVHVLNTTDGDIDTGVTVTMKTLPPAQLNVKLAPFRLGYIDLHLPPMADSEFTTSCDIKTEHESVMMEPFALKLYYLLPHYHERGTLGRVRIAGGTRDGETVFEVAGGYAEPVGKTIDPPLDLAADGATGFTFTCGYHNSTVAEIGYGDAAKEMCFILGFADSTMAFVGQVESGTGSVTGTSPNGAVTNSGPCNVTGFPFYQDKIGGTPN